MTNVSEDTKKEKVDINKIVDQIKKLTLLDASDLVKELEKELGVSAAAPAVQGVSVPSATDAAAEEKTEFAVVLKEHGDQKINVIKVVRGLTGLGLKEAKELVEKEGSKIKENISKEEADKISEELTAAGAKVSIV